LKTFPTSFLKQLKTINYFGVDKNLIFIIGEFYVKKFLPFFISPSIIFSLELKGKVFSLEFMALEVFG